MTTYTFTAFNDPLGTGSTGIMLFDVPEAGTIGLGISATTGTIVGTYIDSNGIPEGFSFNGTTYTTVTDPLAANGTAIWGVNDSGQMVGTLSDSIHNSSSFLESSGQFTAIAYPSAVITYAMGLNDSSQVVGFYEAGGPTNNFVPAGFLLSNGNYTTINDPLGTTATIADAINNHGQIVGIYTDNNNIPHGFLLSGGVYTTIDDPLGVNGTVVKGINDLGEVVGGYLDSNNNVHGFLYANGAYTTIDYPGAMQTMLSGITNSGEILGSYEDSTGEHGFLARPPLYVSSMTAATDTGATSISAGQQVTVTMKLNEAVTVTGTPTLQLNDNEVATYAGGSGTDALTFDYVVQSGDNTSDLQVSGLNLPNGANIADNTGNSLSSSLTGDLGIQVLSQGLLSILSLDQQMELIYIGYFNRSADPGGFSFWEGQNAHAQAVVATGGFGQSAAVALTNIANSFAPQPETINIYPFLNNPTPNFSDPTVQAGTRRVHRKRVRKSVRSCRG